MLTVLSINKLIKSKSLDLHCLALLGLQYLAVLELPCIALQGFPLLALPGIHCRALLCLHCPARQDLHCLALLGLHYLALLDLYCLALLELPCLVLLGINCHALLCCASSTCSPRLSLLLHCSPQSSHMKSSASECLTRWVLHLSPPVQLLVQTVQETLLSAWNGPICFLILGYPVKVFWHYGHVKLPPSDTSVSNNSSDALAGFVSTCVLFLL